MTRKMICTIPERLCTREKIAAAERSFRDIYQTQFGASERLTILWCALPQGQSYVAGEPDEVFIVMLEVDESLEQARREAAMMAINQGFASAFGISLDKPLVSALPPSKVNEYLRANRNRLHWLHRAGFLLGTLWHALVSKQRNGFATIRANL